MLNWIVSSSVLILAVLGLRLLFRGRISQRMTYALWALVLLRLLIPGSILSSAASVANLVSEFTAPPVFSAPVLEQEEALEQVRTLFVDVPGALKRCDKCLEMLEEGMELSVAMRENEFLQASYAKMLAVGMRGGNGDRVMTEVADRMMEDAGLALDNAVAKVEPAMVLAASVIVGMILLAVMLPLANIMASIG